MISVPRPFLRRALGILLLAALPAIHAREIQPLDEAIEEAEKRAFYANRVLLYPVTSFYVNGVNGKYERRLSNRHLGFHLPFYLGRSVVEGVGSTFLWGSGLGVDGFLSTRPNGLRFSAALELIDIRRKDLPDSYFRPDPDPTFGDSLGSDVYHQYQMGASILMSYRWEYPSQRFLADLGIGVVAAWSRQPAMDSFGGRENTYYRTWTLPLLVTGVYPMINFSFGVPF